MSENEKEQNMELTNEQTEADRLARTQAIIDRCNKRQGVIDERKERVQKVTDEIHKLIANNHLNVRIAKKILDEVAQRVERYSFVTVTEPEIEDICVLL